MFLEEVATIWLNDFNTFSRLFWGDLLWDHRNARSAPRQSPSEDNTIFCKERKWNYLQRDGEEKKKYGEEKDRVKVKPEDPKKTKGLGLSVGESFLFFFHLERQLFTRCVRV